MTSRLSYLLVVMALLATCNLNAQRNGYNNNRGVNASGNIETESRSIDGFSEIKVCCSIEVELTRSSNFNVEVEASDNILPLLLTEVRGDRLVIGYKPNTNIRNNSKVRVRISMPNLEGVDVSSSSRVISESTFSGNRLDLNCSSSGKIKLNFEGQTVDADVSSSGRIELSGSADRILAESSSAGTVHAFNLAVKDADAQASSGSSIKLNVSQDLEADASSGASIRYRGNPATSDTDSSSGGRVRRDQQ